MKKIIEIIILGILVLISFVVLRTYQVNKSNTLVTINIQPLNSIENVEDINQYTKEFDKYLKEIGLENYEIKILPGKEIPANHFIDYSYEDMDWFKVRADSLVKFLNTDNKREFTVGITNNDICCDVHGIKNWGVLGLSYLGHRFNSCIVSTCRVKNNKDVWKIMAHEFTHAFFSQSHCKADDPHCIMQDAKKKPKFGIKNHLCDTCMEEVKSKL